jgi:ADP-ribosyl-[dinitrogen reductase] hydrolase
MNSILGALVGDAAGATLEHFSNVITEEIALRAMSMPGGGGLHVGPGQITDDGELILTLWQSLQYSTSNIIHIGKIIKGYAKWYDSWPFDIGQTCSLAFELYSEMLNDSDLDLELDTTSDKNKIIYGNLKNQINTINKNSEANGALMRATAISTWIVSHNLSIELGIKYAKEDALLSHPNIVCQETNAIYVFIIIHLLRGKTPTETIELANEYVTTNIKSEKVKLWYFTESIDISVFDITQQRGHVRWGFIMAIYFLRNPEITYENAIKITLMKGGDTDTNAAIVGGIVGAYHSIPEYMIRPVFNFDCTRVQILKGHIRPIEYSVKKVLEHLV